MAITLNELKERIESLDLRCQKVGELKAIMVGFKLDEDSTYRDRDGDACLAIVFRLAEDGEFLSAFVPGCWRLGEILHHAAAREVLLAVQSRFKFIRFDLAEDMVVANVEVPIEDGTLTTNQVQRIISALVQAVEKYDVAIRRAIETGEASVVDAEVDAISAEKEAEADEEDSANSPPNGLARLLDLMEQAGGLDGHGIESLERLLGGDGPPSVDQ